MFADAVSPPNRRVGEHQIKLTDLKETYQDSTGSSVLRSAQCGDFLPTLTPPLFISRAGELIDERHESAVGPGNDHRRASYLSATQPARGAIPTAMIFVTWPRLVLPTPAPPFFAGAKLPSMKASSNFLSRVSAVYG